MLVFRGRFSYGDLEQMPLHIFDIHMKYIKEILDAEQAEAAKMKAKSR